MLWNMGKKKPKQYQIYFNAANGRQNEFFVDNY